MRFSKADRSIPLTASDKQVKEVIEVVTQRESSDLDAVLEANKQVNRSDKGHIQAQVI